MKTWSAPLAIEAVLCGGAHTLCAPMLFLMLLVPMTLRGTLVFLALGLGAAFSLVAYWCLALATIRRERIRFGCLYWLGAAAAVATIAAADLLADRPGFWALVCAPPVLSWVHFSYLQAQWARRSTLARS